MRRLKHWLEYQGTLLLFFLAQSLPHSWALALGAALGKFTFSVVRIRRRVTLENLANAFPEKSAAEVKQIARRCYKNFGMMIMECLRLPKLTESEFRRLVTFSMPLEENPLEQAVALGKGAICMTGHFGNWEYLGALLAACQYPVVFLYQEQSNPYVDALIYDIRTKMKMPMIPRGAALRGILKALRERKFVTIVADQDAGSHGLFVDFLGRPASTGRGPAAFVLKSQAPIVFLATVRQPGGKHLVESELLTFDFFESTLSESDEEEKLRLITEAWTRVLEKYIRQYPDHWFWMHRRWKTKQGAKEQAAIGE
ncbi:MAG: lysophospholipid acyltransferase family protein [candidate division KSB1 bacterium]|nr:lysophospholipid acyltransferase family protein [candidate division KSB1 bacterium]MDZ7301901.1 lysophospholipid acyltransferase family protein [candidate division KSB1 bacterium]MDZ7310284.1 lysophospholipid acyltransferase family protein [candidate division KSB1 bacterium]